jgi:DNA-binding MarR family transcriptional regulator
VAELKEVRGGGQATKAVALQIDESLFFKLVRVVNLTARPFTETLSKVHDLSLNEWRTMLVLANHPGLVAREVVELTGLDKMSVSRAVTALEQDGRLVRESDPLDARRSRLSLSEQGLGLFQTLAGPAVEREAQLYAGLTREELAAMHASVDKLIAALQG